MNRAVFLKAHGTGDAPLADHWLAAGSWLIDPGRTAFPRRPRMTSGDRLVLYASVWQRIFGVAEVISEPTREDPMAERWPWSVQVELLLVVPVLSNAPPVEAIGVAPRSMSQHSHIRLEERHLELRDRGAVGSGPVNARCCAHPAPTHIGAGMKRIHLITLLAAGALLSAAPAPRLGAASVTKSAGSVSATLSWKKDGEFGPAREPRLQVARAGVVVTDMSVASACSSCALVEDQTIYGDTEPFSIMHVADLDADGEPEVLFDVHSGGAHCCVTTRFFTYRPERNTYARAPSQYWGNAHYEVVDLDGDGRLELYGADDSFAGAFSAYADSAFPPKIIRYTRDPATGRSSLTNVTRRFPQVIRAEAARLLRKIRRAKPDPDSFQTQGLLAAYVAEQYLLHRGSVGKAELARARRRGLTAPGFQTRLLRFLKQTGYR